MKLKSGTHLANRKCLLREDLMDKACLFKEEIVHLGLNIHMLYSDRVVVTPVGFLSLFIYCVVQKINHVTMQYFVLKLKQTNSTNPCI